MAQALTTPYGAKPSQVTKPVPGAEDEEAANALFTELAAPKLAAASPTEAVPTEMQQVSSEVDLDTLFQELTGKAQTSEMQAVPTETFSQRAERTGSTTQAIKETIGDLSARFQASWGVTEKEKMGKLGEIYGAENVKKGKKEDSFLIKRPGEAGFREFDPSGFNNTLEFLGDLLDESRNVVEGSVELGGRIGGGVAGGLAGAAEGGVVGAAAGLPTGPGALLTGTAGAATGGMLGAIAGQAGGGALGSAAGLQLGDYIAENLVGIKQDVAREKGKEMAVAGAIGGTFGAVFGAASGMLARRQAAKEAKKASLTTQEVLQTAQEVEKTAESLARNGIEMRQGKMMLSPGQIAGNVMPEARSLDRELSTEGGVRDFFVQQGKLVLDGWNKLSQGIVNVTGKPAEDIFEATKAASKSAREVEGKTIGAFREMALDLSEGAPMPMPKVHENVPEFMQRFGFKQKGDRVIPPSLKEMQELFPDASPAVLGKATALMTDLQTQMKKNNGNLPLKEVDRLYTSFRSTIDNFYGTQSGGSVARSLINMKNALRDDWAEHIGKTLEDAPGEVLSSYKLSMQKYSDIMSAQDTLKNILKKDELSAAAFANQIFSPALGKKRVAELKTLVQDTDPELWPQLVNQQFNFMQKSSVNPKTGRVDWMKFAGKMDELKKSEILPQMMTKEEQNATEQFFSLAKRVDDEFNFKENVNPGKGVIGMIRNMAILATSKVSMLARVASGKDLFQNTVESLGKDAALLKWLDGAGLELVLKDVPAKEQAKVRSFLMTAVDKGVTATKTAAKLTVRTEMAEQRREATIKGTKKKEQKEAQ